MDLLFRFLDYMGKEGLLPEKSRLLLAVSGGLDSVALCELCKEAGFDFVIGHANFQLRGEESIRDEAFVKALGEKYACKVWIKRFDTEKYAVEKKLSIQVAARELRYAWFYELLDANSPVQAKPSTPLSWIVTAHHLDDNIETLLMHFFRGTGISGLRGMLPKQGRIVRPLLFARKEELKDFAVDHKLSWVEDSSNAGTAYSRNYFRQRVIPLVQQIFPEADSNLAANLGRFREIEALYLQSIQQYKKRLLVDKGSEIHIPVLKLKQASPLASIAYEIIKDFGFSALQTAEFIDLTDRESGKFILSATHRIIRNRNWMIIAPRDTLVAETILIEETTKNLRCSQFSIHLSVVPAGNGQYTSIPSTACLDKSAVQFPLLLRKWKQGDYFYPLGMRKKKKVARFLIDNKMSRTDKEKIWVIEADKKILWVVGMRIDDRFKITPRTKEVLNIEMRMA
jgi:tRNA(Ile)-lysidine synthase